MNWIESIGEAINYIEDNLTNQLEVEKIAGKVYISPSYFQTMFKMLCGFTVSEYIRNRRLACAGDDLLKTNDNIIDIALKYGYDSADSFTRAFTRFHGATPTAVRKKGHTIKSYSPLKLELLVKGGYIMDYRLGKQEDFLIRIKLDIENKSIYYIDDGNLPDLFDFFLGLKYRSEFPECKLYKYIPDACDRLDGFETVTVPGAIWAIFKCSGTSEHTAVEQTLDRIWEEWLPQTNYELLSRNCVTINYADASDEFGEIMIAVKEKE